MDATEGLKPIQQFWFWIVCLELITVVEKNLGRPPHRCFDIIKAVFPFRYKAKVVSRRPMTQTRSELHVSDALAGPLNRRTSRAEVT
jgi:hypothetical protein